MNRREVLFGAAAVAALPVLPALPVPVDAMVETTLLEDYEEGVIQYATGFARYTRIGNMVFFNAVLSGEPSTGYVKLTGLPFEK